jgi:hypothetical protein
MQLILPGTCGTFRISRVREKSRNFGSKNLNIYCKIPKWNLEFHKHAILMTKGKCACKHIIVDFLCHPLVKTEVEFQFQTWNSQMEPKYFFSAK